MNTIFTPAPRHTFTHERHPFWPAFVAAVQRGGYDMSHEGWREFCGFMTSKSANGRVAEVEDAGQGERS